MEMYPPFHRAHPATAAPLHSQRLWLGVGARGEKAMIHPNAG